VKQFTLHATIVSSEAGDTPETLKSVIEEVIGMAGLISKDITVEETPSGAPDA
jgi:hypothetical protein